MTFVFAPKLIQHGTSLPSTLTLALRNQTAPLNFKILPRHVRLDQKCLNTNTLARRENSTGPRNAPTVLMHLDRRNLPARWLP